MKLISFCPFLKMFNSNISTGCKQKPPELCQEEAFQNEKIVSLKKKRKSHIGKVNDLIDKQADFSNIDSCIKSSEKYTKNIRKLTSLKISVRENNFTSNNIT